MSTTFECVNEQTKTESHAICQDICVYILVSLYTFVRSTIIDLLTAHCRQSIAVRHTLSPSLSQEIPFSVPNTHTPRAPDINFGNGIA